MAVDLERLAEKARGNGFPRLAMRLREGAGKLREAGGPETFDETPEISVRERNAWREVLGKEVKITPLPTIVTPEVKSNLERMGVELRFIPRLYIGEIGGLRIMGEEGFLDDLYARHPGWRRYESLNDGERHDGSVGRNLEGRYWRHVRYGDIDFPNLPGVWIAVETMPKPPYGEQYEKSPVTDRLGFPDRFKISWNDVQAAIQKAKQGILSEAGLPNSLEVRMLEALEWNLLANREGWGRTNTYEWVNTEHRGDDGPSRIVVGDSDSGGAAHVHWFHPARSLDHVGFRLAIILGS